MARLSYSAVSNFKACPAKYYLSREFRMKDKPSAFGFGSSFEDGVTELLLGKTLRQAMKLFIQNWAVSPENRWEEAKPIYDSENIFYYNSDFDKELLTRADLRKAEDWGVEIIKEKIDPIKFATTIQGEIKAGNKVSKKEQKLYNRILWTCCKRRGMYMLWGFQQQILPKVTEVVAVQKEINIAGDDDDKVIGYIDYVLKFEGLEGAVVVDNKSAGRPYDRHKLNTSDQLRIYAAATGIENIAYMVTGKKIGYNRFCGACGHHRRPADYRKKNCTQAGCEGKFTGKIPKVETQLLVKTLETRETEDVVADFEDIIAVVNNKIGWKNPESCHNFGTVCEYYEHCWKGKDLKDMKHLEER